MKKKTLFTPKIVQTICNDPKKRREFMVNASYCGRSNREQIDTVS